MFVYDPARVIDISVPAPANYRGLGWIGPYPSRPCDGCGSHVYRSADWNMGYNCAWCSNRFGSDEEWAYGTT